eukprot:jgi/Ulvmu1/45/UM001_0048.1
MESVMVQLAIETPDVLARAHACKQLPPRRPDPANPHDASRTRDPRLPRKPLDSASADAEFMLRHSAPRSASMASMGSTDSIVSMHAPVHAAPEGLRGVEAVSGNLSRVTASSACIVEEDVLSESSATSGSPVYLHQLLKVPSLPQLAPGLNLNDLSEPEGVREPLLPRSPSPESHLRAASAAPTAGADPPPDQVAQGMLCYAASSVFYAGMGTCSKLLQDEGYPVFELTFFRALVILAVSMSAILSTGGSPFGVRRGLLVLRGTLGYASLALFFTSCFYLPLATATTLTFLAPLIVALLSPWVLRETPSRAVAVVIPLCIVGVVLITQPADLVGGGAATLSLAGLAAGLSQPFFAASVKMVVRELRRTEGAQVIILYLVLCTLAYSLLGCALTWRHLITPRSRRDIALLVALGACGYGNQLCTTLGLAKAKAASVMSMQYFSLIFSQIAGTLVFGEFTTPAQTAGMAIIVTCMLGYLWHEARSGKR